MGQVTKAQAAVSGSGATGTTVLTLGSAPTPGNLLLALIGNSGGSTITPPAGWTQIGTTTVNSCAAAAYYRVVQTGDGASYTFTTSTNNGQGFLVELAGAASGAPTRATSIGTSTAPTTGSLTPSATGGYAFAGMVLSGPSTTYAGTPSNGYAVEFNGVGSHSEFVSKSNPTSGSATSSGDTLSGSRAWVGQIILVAAAAGGTPQGQASLSASLSVTDSADVAHVGQGSESAHLLLTSSAGVAHTGTASESSTLTLTSTGNVAHTGRTLLDGSFGVTGQASVSHTGQSSLLAVLTLSASAGGNQAGQASMGYALSMSASASVDHTGRAALSATYSESAQAQRDVGGRSTLDGSLILTATAALQIPRLSGVPTAIVVRPVEPVPVRLGPERFEVVLQPVEPVAIKL